MQDNDVKRLEGEILELQGQLCAYRGLVSVLWIKMWKECGFDPQVTLDEVRKVAPGISPMEEINSGLVKELELLSLQMEVSGFPPSPESQSDD